MQVYLTEVVIRKGGKCGLGFPGHVGVGVTQAVFEYLDYAVTGHIKVQKRSSCLKEMLYVIAISIGWQFSRYRYEKRND